VPISPKLTIVWLKINLFYPDILKSEWLIGKIVNGFDIKRVLYTYVFIFHSICYLLLLWILSYLYITSWNTVVGFSIKKKNIIDKYRNLISYIISYNIFTSLLLVIVYHKMVFEAIQTKIPKRIQKNSWWVQWVQLQFW